MKKNKLVGVYEVVNTINGMRIIGSSVDIKRRWSTYKSQLKRGIYKNPLLQAEVNTYGFDQFDFNILEECHEDILYQREDYYLSQYGDDQLYNIRGINNTYKKVKTEAQKLATARSLSRANSGENNPRHKGKLSDNDLIRIKVMIAEGLSNKEIHSEFEDSTTANMISRIRIGNRYTSVEIPPDILVQQLSSALVRLSEGEISTGISNQVASAALKSVDYNNPVFAHKGMNWYAEHLLKRIDY